MRYFFAWGNSCQNGCVSLKFFFYSNYSMEFHLDNRLPPLELYQKTLAELPVGIVVGIEGMTYIKGVNCVVRVDINGNIEKIEEYMEKYTLKERPKVIYGFLYQTI